MIRLDSVLEIKKTFELDVLPISVQLDEIYCFILRETNCIFLHFQTTNEECDIKLGDIKRMFNRNSYNCLSN